MTATTIVIGVLACVWLLQAALVFLHLAQLKTLAGTEPAQPRVWPRVAAIVPARDEATKIGDALCSRLAEGYPNLEIVVVDDRSTDATPEILAALAASDARVKPVRIDRLPDGWLGKVHALDRGAAASTAEWLLVSDADIELAPGILSKAMAHCLAQGLDCLALLPEFRSKSWTIDVLWAVFVRIFVMLVGPAAVRDAASKTAAGSGAFMLIRRSALDATPGFANLRLETADDMALGAMVKQAGARCDLMNGRLGARVSVYDSLAEFFRGIEKNGSSVAAAPLYAGVAALACIEYAPLVATSVGFATENNWLTALGALATALATLATAAAARRNTGRWWPALLWPIGWAILVAGIVRSGWLARRRGGVMWRGTFYPLAQLRDAQRYRLWPDKGQDRRAKRRSPRTSTPLP